MKLDILFHYEVNEITGEIIFLGKEEITVDTAVPVKKQAVKATSKGIVENSNPLITLDPNKLTLTTGVLNLMNLDSDCRLDIKYKKKDNRAVPVIGTDVAFGTKGGNKLTKSNTISFRGSANSKLAEFGTTFTLEPSEDEGIFYLIGDKMDFSVPDDAVDIEEELDIDILDSFELDEETNLEKFDFTL